MCLDVGLSLGSVEHIVGQGGKLGSCLDGGMQVLHWDGLHKMSFARGAVQQGSNSFGKE